MTIRPEHSLMVPRRPLTMRATKTIPIWFKAMAGDGTFLTSGRERAWHHFERALECRERAQRELGWGYRSEHRKHMREALGAWAMFRFFYGRMSK